MGGGGAYIWNNIFVGKWMGLYLGTLKWDFTVYIVNACLTSEH